MAFAKSVIIVLSCVGLTLASTQSWRPVLEGPYGKDLRECRDIWSKIADDAERVAECMEKLVFALAPRLSDPRGISLIGTPSLDPLAIEHITLANTPMLQGNLTNLRIYNATQYLNPKHCKITYDPNQKVATMVAKGDSVLALADYSLRLNLGALLSAGKDSGNSGTVTSGQAILKAFDMSQTIKLYMRETKSGRGLTIAKTDSDATFNGMDIKFQPSRPDDALGNMLNSMITGDSALSLLKELMVPANRKLSLAIGGIFHKGWWKLDQL